MRVVSKATVSDTHCKHWSKRYKDLDIVFLISEHISIMKTSLRYPSVDIDKVLKSIIR